MGSVCKNISLYIILCCIAACNTLRENEEETPKNSPNKTGSRELTSQYSINTEELNRIFHTHYGEDMTLAEHAHQNVELLNYLQRSHSIFSQKRSAGYESRQKARQKRIKEALTPEDSSANSSRKNTRTPENGKTEQ